MIRPLPPGTSPETAAVNAAMDVREAAEAASQRAERARRDAGRRHALTKTKEDLDAYWDAIAAEKVAYVAFCNAHQALDELWRAIKRERFLAATAA